MQTFLKGRRVGYWLSEKKLKKLNFQAFADMCRCVDLRPKFNGSEEMQRDTHPHVSLHPYILTSIQ